MKTNYGQPKSGKNDAACNILFIQKAKKLSVLGSGLKVKETVLEKLGHSYYGNVSDESLEWFSPSDSDDAFALGVFGKSLKTLSTESYRVLGAKALKAAKSKKFHQIIVDTKNVKVDHLEAFVEGMHLADYEVGHLKEVPKDKKEIQVHLSDVTAATKKRIEDTNKMADAINFARKLGDLPPNYMNPIILAQEVQKAFKGTKAKVTVWDKARLKKERFGGVIGVGQGSNVDPRFIIIEYKGNAKSKSFNALVGKGITFDAGGLNLKPSSGISEMKYDMCGAANVIGAMHAIAKQGLKINVTAYVPAAENLVGGWATKPGDVLTARNGKTYEVNNTDAEGRLILADALAYACEKKPVMIVDAATLTGAMLVSLGNSFTGYFTENSKLKTKIETAAKNADETVWNMPLASDHERDMKGTFADLSNLSSQSRLAGSSTAAAFLKNFVDSKIPWAHVDIAGTAWNMGSRKPYHPPKGATGVMVKTFVELMKKG